MAESTRPADNVDFAGSQVMLAPVMTRREAVMYAVLVGIAVVLTIRYAWWWFQPGHVPENDFGGPAWLQALFDYAPFIALTTLEGLRILQMAILWIFGAVMRTAPTMPVPGGQRVAVLTTIVPSSEPVSILEQTIPAMLAMRHAEPFDVWILDEGDDPEVKAICERYGAQHFSRKGIARYNPPSGPFKARTKAGNHNAWRDQHAADYDIVAQMDPDHIPEPDFLEGTLGYFADPDVAYVIAPQVYYRNTATSWIARGADEANFGFSALTQRGANLLGMPIFIGSNHVARSAALDSVGGYASHIVEDHLTGMQMLVTDNPATGRRWKGVYTERIISLGEGPSRWSSYLSQQLRWAYGLVSIVMANSPRLLPRMRASQVLGFVMIQSFYISVATIIALAGVLTVAHLLFGLNALEASFNSWLAHWLPQLSMSLVVWYWLQRFYLRESDRGWGVRSVVVGLGAMITYGQAVVRAGLRRPLAYVITPKGEVGVREPLRLFRWHLVVLLVSVGAIVFAVATGTGEWIMRFWALLMALQMLIVVVTGSLAPRLLRTSLSSRVTDFCNRYTVRVSLPLVITVAALIVAPQLPSFDDLPRLGAEDEATAPENQAPVRAEFLTAGSDRVGFGSFRYADASFDVPGVIHHYFVDFRPGSVARLRTAVGSAATSREVAMISWEPQLAGQPQEESARLLRQIDQGARDEYLEQAATTLRRTRQPVILRFAPEMDHRPSDLQPWAGSDPAMFKSIWRRVHRIFSREGAGNVRFAWTPVGRFTEGQFASKRWYPGDQWVDMVGFTAYASWRWDRGNPEVTGNNTVRTPNQLVMARYRELARRGKPVIVPEWGADLRPSDRPRQRVWLRNFVRMVDERMPRVSALVYFAAPHNVRGVDIDWRLTPAQQRALTADLRNTRRFELSTR